LLVFKDFIRENIKVFKENLSVYVNTKVLKQLGITLPNEIKNDKAYVEIKE